MLSAERQPKGGLPEPSPKLPSHQAAAPMSLTYFKRFRMEVDLRAARALPLLPARYRLLPWTDDLLDDHAEAKYHSFRGEIDASLFDCLGELSGCRRLMHEISRKPGFLPEATWLIDYTTASGKREVCGTIQGVKATSKHGGIQNVGVTPFHRGLGLGRMLVEAALFGFQQAGLPRAYLEVTAQNQAAVQVYSKLGFRKTKTLYKGVELALT